jgi:hypothetical protein
MNIYIGNYNINNYSIHSFGIDIQVLKQHNITIIASRSSTILHNIVALRVQMDET